MKREMYWRQGSWKSRPGVALLIVLMIGLLAFVAMTGLLGAVAPRRRTIGDEAVSDRSMALAESFIDQLLARINAAQELPKSSLLTGGGTDQVIARLLAELNGGDACTETLAQIRARVQTCVYDTTTSSSYLVVEASFTKGILTSGTLISMDDGSFHGTLALGDPSWASDHQWFQIDTNCDYWYSPDNPDAWRVRVTAFNISVPELRCTVQAETGPGLISTGATLNWYRRTVGPAGDQSFCEYAGFYNGSVSFGPYELVTGSMRSNGDISISGWAQARIDAHGAVRDGSSGSGRFGLKKWSLTQAVQKGYASSGYPAGDWTSGDRALYGTDPVRRALDTGMQDQCLPAYYVTGDATVVFGTDAAGVGNVAINGTTLEMPLNGLIFVEGNAWVGGTVQGRCTLGCRGTINIQDDIIYAVAPRVNRSDPMPLVPDALGLVAGQQVFIPRETYETHPRLRVDAAIFSRTGGLQIDPTAGTHSATLTLHHEAFWNGSQSLYDISGGRTPLVSVGGQVRGYELQHTNYDWNLKDYGPPPLFPATGTQALAGQVGYTLLASPVDAGILSRLTGVVPIALSESAADYDSQCATFYCVVDGIRYYTAGPSGAQYARYSAEQDARSRYRASWREQIAAPVRH